VVGAPGVPARRQTDMALVGGRMESLVSYDVGFTKHGIIQGVDIRAWLLRGAYPDASFDQLMVKMSTDMVSAAG
jgi:xanthine dehydrogenase molybdopterin-binding subunit B